MTMEDELEKRTPYILIVDDDPDILDNILTVLGAIEHGLDGAMVAG
jgi:hypothetical protein